MKTIAVLMAAALVSAAEAASFQCSSATAAPNVLTMQCNGLCSNAWSPCLLHSNASGCQSDDDSECIEGDGGCAIECLNPFSGSDNSSWNLLIADSSEVAEVTANESFRFARVSPSAVHAVNDLAFPSSVKKVYVPHSVDG